MYYCIRLHYCGIWYCNHCFPSWNLDCFSFRCQNSGDVLGKSLANLQKELNDMLADAQREKEKAWARQRQLQEEMGSQQDKLEEAQEKYRQVRIETTKTRVRQFQPITFLSAHCTYYYQNKLNTLKV